MSIPDRRGAVALAVLPELPPDRTLALSARDVAACQALTARHSRSFYLSSLLLPRVVRQQAWALYAFCRTADDAVDGTNGGDGLLPTDAPDAPADKLARVAALTSSLDRVYSPSPTDTLSSVERSLRSVVLHSGLPQAVPQALLHGMKMDAEDQTYATWDSLLTYCFAVAGTVGVMMTYVMGHRMPAARRDEVLLRACDLGIAMQLTNIARDIAEDASRGRVYLPDDLLAHHGLSRADVLALPTSPKGYRSPALCAAVQDLLLRADAHYHAAERGIAMLPASAWLAIGAASAIYRAIGTQLLRWGGNPLRGRARVSTLGKLWLVAQSWMETFRAKRQKPPAAPTVGPADPLLRALLQSACVIDT